MLDNSNERLVQKLDEESAVSFDELAGKFAGAQRAEAKGVVRNVNDYGIILECEAPPGSVFNAPLRTSRSTGRPAGFHEGIRKVSKKCPSKMTLFVP